MVVPLGLPPSPSTAPSNTMWATRAATIEQVNICGTVETSSQVEPRHAARPVSCLLVARAAGRPRGKTPVASPRTSPCPTPAVLIWPGLTGQDVKEGGFSRPDCANDHHEFRQCSSCVELVERPPDVHVFQVNARAFAWDGAGGRRQERRMGDVLCSKVQ